MSDELNAVAILQAVIERLRNDRKWIRTAEDFYPREMAQYVDSLVDTLRKAEKQLQANDLAGAVLTIGVDGVEDEEL